MSALAILPVAPTADTARGPATSEADADAFARALTDADVGTSAPAQPARPTTSITRDNSIRGDEVAVRPEAANTNEAVIAAPVHPLLPSPVAPPSGDSGTTGSETTSGGQTLVAADAGGSAVASTTDDALPKPEASSPATLLATAGIDTATSAEAQTQTTPSTASSAEDAAAQAAATTSKMAADVALLTASSETAPSANGLAPQPLAPREIIERALRAGSQTEATATDDATSDENGAPSQATGEKTAAPQNTATPSAPRPAAETPQQTDVAALTASVGGEQAETGSASVSGATTTETPTVTAQDLTLSTLARATIETTAQLSAQIVRKLEGRYTRFELALTPEGLGRVDVSLDIDSDGQLAARLAFDNPAAAIDLRGRADELRRQLEEAGFRIASDGLDFAERDTSSGGGFDRGQNQQGNRAFAGASRLAAMADDTVAVPSPWIKLNLTPRGVDMKV